MKKINYFGIVPIGILAQIYSNTQHWQDIEGDMKIIYQKYDDIRHLFAMNLVTSK